VGWAASRSDSTVPSLRLRAARVHGVGEADVAAARLEELAELLGVLPQLGHELGGRLLAVPLARARTVGPEGRVGRARPEPQHPGAVGVGRYGGGQHAEETNENAAGGDHGRYSGSGTPRRQLYSRGPVGTGCTNPQARHVRSASLA